jgi:hypothetical protein
MTLFRTYEMKKIIMCLFNSLKYPKATFSLSLFHYITFMMYTFFLKKSDQHVTNYESFF